MNGFKIEMYCAVAIGLLLTIWWYMLVRPTAVSELDEMFFLFSCVFMFAMPSISVIMYHKNMECET